MTFDRYNRNNLLHQIAKECTLQHQTKGCSGFVVVDRKERGGFDVTRHNNREREKRQLSHVLYRIEAKCLFLFPSL